MPMTELNKLLAEAFGQCWHEYDYKSHRGGPAYCSKPKCITQIKVTQSRFLVGEILSQPNYFTLVTLKCEKCGGSGRAKIARLDYAGIFEENGFPITGKVIADNLPDTVPCPCQGKPRIISRLQHEIEKRGEWEKFHKWCCRMYDEVPTDLIKLADAYLKWRKS